MVVIEIESGNIRGKVCEDVQGKKFYSFQNIPYAAPPLGELRFKAPQPVQSWPGIKDCTEEGNESISRHLLTRKIVGSEDCLNLNVYTPELPQNNVIEAKPVMFWIHGGIFLTGSNKTEFYGPEFLMTENVVLVTINYRLGILGFLSLDDPSLGVPGNAAFKDMVMALKWVQKNIHYFCGNPNNVTVFGESAGAAAAHLLMLSPMTKGLLHKVIAQSASALNVWVYGQRSAKLITKALNFSGSDERKIFSFLKNAPAKELLKAQIKIDNEGFLEDNYRFIGAVVERPSNEECFLSEKPIDIILKGNYNHVPLIMGYNEREGMAFDNLIPIKSRERFFKNLELSVPLQLNIQRGSTISRDIANMIQRFYYDDTEPNRKYHAIHYSNLCTDTVFLKDIYFSIKHHLKTSTRPIYFYKMTLHTELNIFKKITGATVPGVYHGDDVGYLFKTMFTPEIVPNSIEDISRRRFTKLWTNFAYCENPTPYPNDDLLKINWQPAEKHKMHFLEIGEELKMKVNPEANRMAFWEKIYQFNPAVSKL